MLKRARTGVLLAVSFALAAPAVVEAQGVLLLAHGGRDDWNRKVLELASQVDSTVPVEVAFGMANKRTIQDAVDRLAERDVTEIVAVPLFISSHSSVMRATEYLLGSRADAPPELEAFARMGARMGARRASGGPDHDPDFDWTAPLEATASIAVTTALDSHALVAEILLSRALGVSEQPEQEVVVVVARPDLGRGQCVVAREHGHPRRDDSLAHALQPHPVPDGARRCIGPGSGAGDGGAARRGGGRRRGRQVGLDRAAAALLRRHRRPASAGASRG